MNQEGHVFVRLDENKIVCIWVHVGIEMNIWAAMIDTLCSVDYNQLTHSLVPYCSSSLSATYTM